MSILAQSGRFSLRKAQPVDAVLVGARLRLSDQIDLWATTHERADNIILRNLSRRRKTFSIDFNGLVAATGGVTERGENGRSVIWLLGNDDFDVALKAGGAKLCKSWLKIIADGQDKLFNIVPESNHRTVRWMKWLGFKEARRHLNFRGLGHDCVELYLLR